MKKKFGLVVFILALLIFVGAAAFVLGKNIRKEESVTTQENLITETETVITGEIIREGLADIGELATEEYYFTEVETYDSSKKFKDFEIPFTTSRFVYSYDGTIKAGVDFASIGVEKDDLTKTITVKLPKARILSSEIDENSFKMYDEKQSIFNKISISNFNATNADLKKRAEEKALAKGLLDRADANAITLIKNFLHSTYDISDYAIKVVTEE
ncbi:MAG: DUF4230 domain-containing protein [Lachnospiraceae bacterium]|nr:DUF4230 domain-containing protein [Lachnospiraceae bacterium]